MNPHDLRSRWPAKAAIAIAGLLLITGTALRLGIALNRDYFVDEVEHIHAVYDIASGKTLYRDFWEPHTPLLYGALRPFFSAANPPASFNAGRMLSFFVSMAIVFFTYKIAARVFSKNVAIAAAVLLTFNTTFAERSIEIRPDPWMTLCTLAALWLEIREDHRLRHSICAGLLLGVSFLFTQKSAISLVILVFLWILRAVKKKHLREALFPLLFYAIPILLSFLYFRHAGALKEYIRYCFLTPGETVSRSAAGSASGFSPVDYFRLEAVRNRAFLLFAAGGIVISVIGLFRTRRQLWLPGGSHFPLLIFLFAILIQALSLWVNPFPYPYFHVTILPCLAIASAVAMVALSERLQAGSRRLVLGVILCALVMQSALPRLYAKTADTKSYQLSTLNEIQRITQPDDSVVDFVGLYFRPDGCFTPVMTRATFELYSRGYYPRIIPQMIQRQTVAIMTNYRTSEMPAAEREFMNTHFVHYKGNIFVQGCALADVPRDAERKFQVLKSKNFRLIGGQEALEIDGIPFKGGFLSSGIHVLRAVKPIDKAVLIMDPPGVIFPHQPPYVGFYVTFD